MPIVNETNVTGSDIVTDKSDSKETFTLEKVNEIVHAALTAREKRSEKKYQELLETSLNSFAERFQPAASKEVEATIKSQQSPEVQMLQKKLEAIESERKKEREVVQKQAQSAREDKAYAHLKSELSGKVKPEAIEAVAKLLFHADKRISVKEDGSVAYKVDEDNELSLQDGIKQYLKSKDAGLFIPAPLPAKGKPGPKPAARGNDSSTVSKGSPEQKTLDYLAKRNLV